MADPSAESLLTITSRLLTYYSYEVGSQAQTSLLERWLDDYSPEWVRLALIESLYRGRYKTISVRGLLADWQRRGQPIYHFNREFEALVCHNFPQAWFNQDASLPEEKVAPTQGAVNTNWDQQPPSTAAKHSALDEHSVTPSSRNADPSSVNHSNSQAPFMSEKLWGFVVDAETVDAETNGTSPGRLMSVAPVSMADQPSSREASAGPLEASPIGQFTPEKEFSELYLKLVSMVSSG